MNITEEVGRDCVIDNSCPNILHLTLEAIETDHDLSGYLHGTDIRL